MVDCPFCKILAGDLAGSLVHQDELCTVLMDIQPINPGHMLVVPNEHYPSLAELPPEIGEHIFQVSQKTASALRKSGIKCEGVNFFVADGIAAMQDVFHFHLHVIPRFEDDGFGFYFSPRYAELPTREELDKNSYYIQQAFDRPG